jgi:hypothetical protein
MHHKRKLNFKHFENNVEENIWSLFWYGRIFFKLSESRFYIEAYFVLMKSDNYYMGSINKKRLEKVEMPFSKSVLFPLSSQFDYEGKYIRMSDLYNDKGLYKTRRLELNKYSFRIKGLDDILSNTLFPNIIENEMSIYKESSYFISTINSVLKNNEGELQNIVNHYIIPVDVILKYFLGFSSLIFDLLITDRLRDAIFGDSIDPVTGKGKLYYNSNYITRADASKIAKYYFTKNNKAKKMFNDIGLHFRKIRYHNSQEGSFIKFKIPFDFPCDFVFVGQYLTKNNSDSNVRKIIVNQILEMSADENFFLVDGDIDLIDTNYTQNQNDEENESKVKDIRINDDVKPTNETETGDLPLGINNNDRIVDNPVILRDCFTDSPRVNHLVPGKDKDGNPIYIDDERPVDHPDFPYYEGTNRRKTTNYTNIPWIEIIEEAVEYLVNKKQYQMEKLSDKVTERLNEKIIFNLMYNDVNYYILDSGGNNYFPLFRNKNKNESIDINYINEMIEIIKNQYKSSWSIVSSKKSLKNLKKFSKFSFLEENDILFLRNNTHQLIEKEGKDTRIETVENLGNKIHKKILKDLKESSVN